jgi:hypothetical protein
LLRLASKKAQLYRCQGEALEATMPESGGAGMATAMTTGFGCIKVEPDVAALNWVKFVRHGGPMHEN